MDIVFVPGLNCTSTLFAEQMTALRSEHQCHIADHTRHDNLEAMASAILHEAPRRFALVGLSMGGYVAYEMIRQQPRRVGRLALLDTRARLDTAEERERREQSIGLARAGRFEDLHHSLWQRLVHPARHADRALEAKVLDMMRGTGPEAFIRQQTAIMNRRDYAQLLPSIEVPTLVLVGAQDAITPPDHARELHEAIRGSTYVELEGCGHLSSMEQPDAVTAALRQLMRGERAAG